MDTRTKKLLEITGILVVILLIVWTGRRDDYIDSAKEAKQDTESIWLETEANTRHEPAGYADVSESIEEPAEEDTEEQEPSGSFKITYQGQEAENEIELRHCEQVYHADGIRIYARYIYDLWVPETFPYNQYVLYIQTPQEQTQLYPIADFLVDKDQKMLYVKIVDDDSFACVQCFSLAEENASVSDTGKELFDLEQAGEMLCNAFEKAEEGFSDINVFLTETKTGREGILCGETGGIEKATGQRYYVDWQIDLADNTQRVTPCILKQYDPDTDREIFAESSRIFDQIEQGDWSCVKKVTDRYARRGGLDYLWGDSEGEWVRMDVNGDGLPELINGWELSFEEDVKKIKVTYIFAYEENMAELVYIDINDGMEFLYLAGNGNLVYEWGVSGGPYTNIQRLCRFDLKWKREYLDTLVRYRFPEADVDTSFTDEESAAYFREYYTVNYPDTYGVGGAGIYYLRERPKTEKELADNKDGRYTVREYLTEEQFMGAYKEMTGWDFDTSRNMY